MKKLNLTERKGFAQIFLLVGMLLVAVSLPLATKLVQQNQENRSKAASTTSSAYTTTCTYTCYTWSSCKVDGSSLSGGSQVCLTETKTPSGCTGGSKKVGSTRNCTPVAPTPTKKPECTVATYNRTCTAGKEKYCGAGNKIVTYTCPYGSCKSNTACGDCNDTTNQGCSTGYHCVSGSCVKDAAQKPAQCGSKNGGTMDHAPNGTEACYEGAIHFTDATASSGTYKWTCTGVGTGNVASCSAKSSKTKCEEGGGKCVQSSSGMTGGVACALNGSSTGGRTVLNVGCATGYVCCMPAAAKQNGVCVTYGATAYYDRVDVTCVSGTVAWSDSVANDGTYNWKCKGLNGGSDSGECTAKRKVNGKCGAANTQTYSSTPDSSLLCNSGIGSTVTLTGSTYKWTCAGANGGSSADNCSATKKKGGGGGGGSSPGYSYPALVVIPSALILKVGESATVTASDTVTWSSDKADIAMVTADGVVVGVARGMATITATNEFGETAKVAVSVITKGTETLSFKVAFAGIKPSYTNSLGESYSCIGSLGSLTVEILNRPTNTYGKFSDIKVSVVGNEIDSKGNQVFQVSNLEVGSSFATVNNFNYVKIKGPFHLKRRMCKDGQTGKLDETTTCDISLLGTDGYIYDFSEYTLLAGDVDLNGVINSVDFSLVKNAVNADAEPSCGRGNDLNMDGVVNALDLNLVKDSLSSIDDE